MRRPTPKLGWFPALLRYYRDPSASILGKLVAFIAVIYAIVPVDLIPDVPVVGWIDDIGVMGLATAWLLRAVARYRTPGLDLALGAKKLYPLRGLKEERFAQEQTSMNYPPNAPPPGGYGGPPPGGYGPPPGGYGPPPPGPGMGMGPMMGGAMMSPHAPYGIDPMTGMPFSDKSKMVAGLLQIFLGSFGVGRFYTGHIGLGVAQLLLSWMTCGIWPLIDGIMMLMGKVPDAQGRPLRD